MVLAADAMQDLLQANSGASVLQAHYEWLKAPEVVDRYIVLQGSGGSAVLDLNLVSTGAVIFLEQPVPAPLSGHLNDIENTFGLTREELARVLRTTRKTIYNWLSGSAAPHKKNLRRLFSLVVVAHDWRDAGFEFDSGQLHRHVLNNRSVFDLLCEDAVDRERILFAGSRLALAQSRQPFLDPFA